MAEYPKSLPELLSAANSPTMNEPQARACIEGLLALIQENRYQAGLTAFEKAVELADKWLSKEDALRRLCLQYYAEILDDVEDRRLDEKKVYRRLLAERGMEPEP